MQYVSLGRSGVQVSRICLGCMSFGSKSWRPWVLEHTEALPFFRKAVEAGINFFDTANIYSMGESERIVGRAIKEYLKPEEAVVATKVFYAMSDRPNMQGLSRKHVVQACEASLKRLGLEKIDLYQIHRFDPHTPMDEILAGLDSLVTSGKVRYLGASSMPAWRFCQMLERARGAGQSHFVSMQNHYNLLFREEEREMLPLCDDQRIAVLPWSPLARGRLARTVDDPADATATTRAGSDDFAAKLYGRPSDKEIVDQVREVAASRNVSPAQIATAWLLSKRVVTSPIVGTTKQSHLDDAVAAVSLTLTAEEVAKLEAPYQAHPGTGY
jgi:aryl-alcohol dehydrogenase-like predicted oxidoreductase